MPPDFQLHEGSYLGAEVFDPVPIEGPDPQTATHGPVEGDRRSLSDQAPARDGGHHDLAGAQLAERLRRPCPTDGPVYFDTRARESMPVRKARKIESAFLSYGMQADALDQLLGGRGRRAAGH